jgi:hypothetical protein
MIRPTNRRDITTTPAAVSGFLCLMIKLAELGTGHVHALLEGFHACFQTPLELKQF